jgi:DNA-binding MurR/RpiR family transcriptional regulator
VRESLVQRVGLNGGAVFARITAAENSLVPSDRRVARVLMEDPAFAIRASVSEVAQRAKVAPSTVIRASQRIGFDGFQDLRMAVAADLARQSPDSELLRHGQGVDERTPPPEVLRRILWASARAIQDATATVDGDAFTAAVQRVAAARRLLIVGNGTSDAPAQDAAYRFTTLGLVVQAPQDPLAQHLSARLLSGRDACIVVSHTGATNESLAAAQAASDASAFVIAVTSLVDSPLTAVANVALIAGGPDQGFRGEAMVSRLAHLAVLDALFVGVALARPKESRSALDHMAEVTRAHSSPARSGAVAPRRARRPSGL